MRTSSIPSSSPTCASTANCRRTSKLQKLIPADLEYHVVPIDSVRQHPENYNNADTDAIGESLDEHGFYVPITVQRSTGYILRGNGTWFAAKEAGAEFVPICYRDVDDQQALAILVGDNHFPHLARPDLGKLHDMLTDLKERQRLRGTGHTVDTIEELRRRLNAISHAELDADEKPKCAECGRPLPKRLR